MKRPWSLLLVALAALVVALAPRTAAANDEEAARLEAHGKALRYSLKPKSPPSPIDMGGAAILVNAPIAEVRKIVTNYGSYKSFLKPFDQSRVLSKRKGVSEVYLQVPILHGAVHIWAVADMSPPTKSGAEEVITSRFKRGNVTDFRAVWHMRAVDADRTVLKLELLVDPGLPFAASLITKQLTNSAEKGVNGVKERAQAAAAARRPAPAPIAAAQPDLPKSTAASAKVDGATKDEVKAKDEQQAGPAEAPPAGNGDQPAQQLDVAKR